MEEDFTMAKILVIDDDEAILRLAKNVLRKDGHDVTCASQITDSLINNLAYYELILLDVMMPHMDGFTFCEQNRKIIDCPIIFLTAKGMEEDLEYGFSLGADDYIKKPFSIVELRARVNAHLRREHRQKHQGFQISGLCFLLAEKEIRRDNTKIGFTKSEYEICLLLAKNHGRVFSKEQIYENVYGYEGESDISVITEHIKNIRRKLAEAGVTPIETVWGIGYKWV